MADSYKRQVRLSEIVPGTNPRRDFGDIGELAAAIEATGGQPVNPPVVVADGDVYRLVDGERRVRALRKIHGDEGMVDVLVFTSYDDAEEAVAMVATDAKQGLTDQERARGFQRMLLLGVEERTVAKALRRKVEDVRKAAKVASIAPEQATLDQMIAAAQFDDEDERKAVLGAGNGWSAKAESIKREHERAEKNAPIMAELERLGLPIVEDHNKAEGSFVYGGWFIDVDRLREWAEGVNLEGAVAEPYAWGTGFYVYTRRADPVSEPAESPEVVALRERQNKIASAYDSLLEHLLVDVATTDVMPHLADAFGRIRRRIDPYECNYTHEKLTDLGVAERIADELLACPASSFEIVQRLHDPDGLDALEWYQVAMELLPPAVEDGYSPSEEDEWLLEQAVAEQAEIDAEEGEEE